MRSFGSARGAAFVLAAAVALALPLRAEAEGTSRAAIQAQLKALFPQGVREGHEGAMKLGGLFRTVSMRSWQQCQDFCRKNTALGGGRCAVWTFVKAENPKMPSVCRIWPDVPELRPNSLAISGPGW